MAQRDRIASVMVDGQTSTWHAIENAVGAPRVEILAGPAARHEIVVRWAGEPIRPRTEERDFVRVRQGEMRWWHMAEAKNERTLATGEQQHLSGRKTQPGDSFEPVDLSGVFNDRVTQIFKHEYRAPRSPFVSLAMPKQGIGAWAGDVNATAEVDDSGLRAAAAHGGGRIVLPNGVPFATPTQADAKNVVFTSQWDNFPREASVPLGGRARGIYLLLAGSTNHMQSRIENGEVVVTYADGTSERLALENPTNWWPIEQDYFIDDYQFRVDAPELPIRVDLKTGQTRMLEKTSFKGKGGVVPGGSATVLSMSLAADKELKSLTVRTLSNEVVVGLMAATLAR
jgi:hypothetical protein